MLYTNENSFLYTYAEMLQFSLTPLRVFVKERQNYFSNSFNPVYYTPLGQTLGAYFDVFDRIIKKYNKPEFGIKNTIVDDEKIKISEEYTLKKDFCNLLHFKKSKKLNQQQMLIVAPLSGHYATLLRGTVEGLLPYYDVYITEWLNPRDIPATKGDFGFKEYVEYCIEFIEKLSPNLSVMAVCQPVVPVLAAISLMHSNNNKKVPDNMILIGGPVDARKSPTHVNNFAINKSIEWFEKYLITRVPYNFDGYMRRVYPGFLQLTGFMSMNMQRHIGAHVKLFSHLIEGDGDSIETHNKFYDEYLSVMDMCAEFYLETIDIVFKKYSLPDKKLYINDQLVDPSKITNTRLLCIEGEKDDISGIGQTKAAIDLCSGIKKQDKFYHLQKDVGHYGTFNGKRFKENIVAEIRKFTNN